MRVEGCGFRLWLLVLVEFQRRLRVGMEGKAKTPRRPSNATRPI